MIYLVFTYFPFHFGNKNTQIFAKQIFKKIWVFFTTRYRILCEIQFTGKVKYLIQYPVARGKFGRNSCIYSFNSFDSINRIYLINNCLNSINGINYIKTIKSIYSITRITSINSNDSVNSINSIVSTDGINSFITCSYPAVL